MRKLTLITLPLLFVISCGQSGVLNKDLIYKAKEKGAPGDVVFSHVYHVKVKKQKCSSCHPELFKKKFGYDKITMQLIWEGKSCGACHNGQKAFSAKDKNQCIRCHSIK
ncbi:cytochrome c3 family protein [Desulfurobacterium atlanticum]|uniref:C(7)-type cytochrome triheme domain-containing protein n=1 Tax=Desulfurobacterium atlanticum TaxID=240169 RepID=A0A238Y1Q7_9BACT|nr:cytochrome c3 family protein [Desulfurobacterium atlanticum]SNR65236.1 c(7)-type cytochrome triheme domain-containing protein [Desulfurobacterium atlanticum]